ncbi:LOW QUALITY PROTEIN: uncharacterized protein O3C94_018931 [Discoglossus pictus]
MASADLREELNCSICLSIYTDPVTLACGHNFCQVCIGRVLDTQEGSGVYTCPECRETFNTRPAVQRNLKLPHSFHHTEPERNETGIYCTYCIHSPVPAAKSCLMCEASLCDNHVRIHSKSPEHVLSEPTTSWGDRKCSIHKKPLEYYCSEDAFCICVSCSLAGDHRGHQVELLNEASEKKKKKLRDVLEKLTSKRKEIERRVQRLQEHRREVQERAADVTETVTALIRDIREQLEVLEKRVLSEVTRQEEKLLLQVSDLIQQLEIEKDELSRKMSHIEKLSTMTDPLSVLQEKESHSAEKGDNEDTQRDDTKVPAGGGLDEGLISETLYRGLYDIVIDIKVKSVINVQEASDILLDVNTAGNNITVSEDLKTVSWSGINQQRPETPERFINDYQVLSTRSFSSGRHYWEVETSESGDWRVGMCYPSIERRGRQSWIGYNKKSWCLCLSGYTKDLIVIHNSVQTPLYSIYSCNRYRIFLDYEAGRLSFYQLCDPIRHLHTFTAAFTEPLHVAFWVWRGGWIRIRRPVILPWSGFLCPACHQGHHWRLPPSPGERRGAYLWAQQHGRPPVAGRRLRPQRTLGLYFPAPGLVLEQIPVAAGSGRDPRVTALRLKSFSMVSDLREELYCCICTKIYTDPVALPCGHTYCLVCIQKTWDNQDDGDSSCPMCRQRFKRKPELKINLKLRNIVQSFHHTEPERNETGIFCTYCIHSPVRAAKSCLMCEASLCDNHVRVHSKTEEYVLSEPTTSWVNRKCPIHNKPLEYYCSEDAACICVSCSLAGEHRGHQVEMLNEASEKKKKKLRNVLEKLTSKRKMTERRAQRLQEHRREVQERAAGVTETVTALIRDIRRQLEVLEKRVLSEITRQEEKLLLQVSDLIQQLEKRKDELSRKMSDIEELSTMTEPLLVLQDQESHSAEKGDNEDTQRDDKKVRAGGNVDEGLISETLYKGLDAFMTDIKVKSVINVQEASDILLDVNTAANNITVSEDLKTVSRSGINQQRPETPERLQCPQVLSTRSFSSGRHYWEVETSESGGWRVGMCYPSIKRRGGQSRIGYNKKSWCLCYSWYNTDLIVIHNSVQTPLSPIYSCNRYRISLDYEAGRLSFYQLCDPIRHLHTFTAKFTEPLHVAFWVWRGSWVRIRS